MIIADTGFWLAVANDKDQYHALALEKFTKLTEPLVTTWPVMTEVCHLLLKRRGIKAELGFIQSYCDGAFLAFNLDKTHLLEKIS